MKLRLATLILCLALVSPAFAEKEVQQSVPVPQQSVTPSAPSPVKPEDNTCQTDADCATVTISCNSCCPGYAADENAAVNKDHVQDYQSLGVCTEEHIKNCGVPECGMAPTFYPAATCEQGSCKLYMHAPEPRTP